MKLYAWQPKGYGDQSIFVMAESEEKAIAVVREKISELIAKGDDEYFFENDRHYSELDFRGFGTDYYELTVLDENEVIFNSND